MRTGRVSDKPNYRAYKLIYGSSAWNLLHATHMVHIILKWLPFFRNICSPMHLGKFLALWNNYQLLKQDSVYHALI